MKLKKNTTCSIVAKRYADEVIATQRRRHKKPMLVFKLNNLPVSKVKKNTLKAQVFLFLIQN